MNANLVYNKKRTNPEERINDSFLFFFHFLFFIIPYLIASILYIYILDTWLRMPYIIHNLQILYET